MSTMRADLLQNRLGTSHPSVTRADFVKAWGRANQVPATPTLDMSFNVSSLGDDAVGTSRFTFIAAFTAPPPGTVGAAVMTGYTNTFSDWSAVSALAAVALHVEAAALKDTALMAVAVTGTLA